MVGASESRCRSSITFCCRRDCQKGEFKSGPSNGTEYKERFASDDRPCMKDVELLCDRLGSGRGQDAVATIAARAGRSAARSLALDDVCSHPHIAVVILVEFTTQLGCAAGSGRVSIVAALRGATWQVAALRNQPQPPQNTRSTPLRTPPPPCEHMVYPQMHMMCTTMSILTAYHNRPRPARSPLWGDTALPLR